MQWIQQPLLPLTPPSSWIPLHHSTSSISFKIPLNPSTHRAPRLIWVFSFLAHHYKGFFSCLCSVTPAVINSPSQSVTLLPLSHPSIWALRHWSAVVRSTGTRSWESGCSNKSTEVLRAIRRMPHRADCHKKLSSLGLLNIWKQMEQTRIKKRRGLHCHFKNLVFFRVDKHSLKSSFDLL